MKKTAQERLLARLQEIKERGGYLRRDATVGVIDKEARTVELSFSSETEKVERWFGIEVLGHDQHEVNLTRMNNSAPALWMHVWEDQRGVVVPGTARIDGDRIGRCTVRYSRSPEGEKLFQDIVDKIVTKVSVGYTVEGMRLVEERDGIDVYRVNAWTPYEVSNVSVAADDDIGVGRSLEKPQEEPRQQSAEDPPSIRKTSEPTPTPPRTLENMNIKNLRDGAGNLVRAKVDDNGNIVEVLEILEKAGDDVRNATARGLEAERTRVRSISEMGKQYGKDERAAEFIREGKSAEEFQRAILADYAAERAKQTPLAEQERGAEIGMDQKDLKRYSLMNVIRALSNPNDAAAQRAAAFEIECSIAAQRQYGKEAKGILIPADVLARGFNAGGAANTPAGATTGSNLVATELMSGSFIEMLRNRTTLMRLGTVLSGLVGNVEIPKQTGGATAYWVGEGGDATEGTPTIGQIALNPKTVAAYTDITRRLAMQSTPDAERIVVNDLRNAMSQAIDFAGYYAPGTGVQPKGIKNYTGINAVDFAAANPTFAELVQMETEIAADNADIGQMGYVGNARFRGHCKTTQKFSDTNGATIWEPGNTVNGYRAEITNQVANGDVFFGNFADLVIALWGGLDLTVDPYSLSKSGGLRLVVFQDVDFVLRRVESLAWGSQAVTP